MKKTVCIDLDGTLAHYEGWKGILHIGEPRPGAVELTQALHKQARIVIYTTRTKADVQDRPDGASPQILAYIVCEWLNRHGFAYDEVYIGQGKPLAAAYLDDRAVAIPTNPQTQDFEAAQLQIEDLLQK